MDQKIGRNDPCPCGSGKKYKACCLQKETSKYSGGKRKFAAKWINAPLLPNLVERTFGKSIAGSDEKFVPPSFTDENPPKEQ